MMHPSAIEEAARALRTARCDRVRIDGLPEPCRPSTLDDAYRIQDRLIALLGEPVAGWKIGATSQKARDFVGISDGSLRARMLDMNCYEHPAALGEHFFFMRALECEFAFTLGRDLAPGAAPFDEAAVLAAIADMHPAIEISDSRYTDWTRVGGPSLVADNCNDGAFVRGPPARAWRGTDLTRHQITLHVDDRVVAQGSGGEVIGGPLGILVWLANDLAAHGMRLGAGQVVTTGTCTGVVPVEPGARVRADFGNFGAVEAEFRGSASR